MSTPDFTEVLGAGENRRYSIKVQRGLAKADKVGTFRTILSVDRDTATTEFEMDVQVDDYYERTKTVVALPNFRPLKSAVECRIKGQQVYLNCEFDNGSSRSSIVNVEQQAPLCMKFTQPALEKAALPFALKMIAAGLLDFDHFTLLDMSKNISIPTLVEVKPPSEFGYGRGAECSTVVLSFPEQPKAFSQKYYFRTAPPGDMLKCVWGAQVIEGVEDNE